jgi:HEAT repeat protein
MNIHHQNLQNQDRISEPRPVSNEVCLVLNEILSDGVDVHRCLAARASGRIGAPATVEPLIAALLDEDEDVRTDAAEALSQIADPRAGQQLLENLLGDPCTGVKLAAIETLAKLNDAQVIPWLQRIVKGRDEEIVWDEEDFFVDGWNDWVDIQVKAIEALADLNAGEAVPDIVAAIRDEDAQDLIEAAFGALARMGPPGIEALAGFLDEKSTRLRRRAAAALAIADIEAAKVPMARALADRSVEVRLAAIRARATRFPADGRLEALLDDPNATVRAEGVRLFGGRYPIHLASLADDASKSVQVAALTALADLADYSADDALVTSLLAKLADSAPKVVAESARALANVAPHAAMDALIALLGNTKRPVEARLGALRGLATLGGKQSVEALVGVIDDPARAIRLETMSALARLAGANDTWPNAAGTALISALRGVYEPDVDDDPKNRTATTLVEPREEDGNPAPANEDEEEPASFPTSTLNAILTDMPDAAELVGLPEEGIDLTPADMERLAMAKAIKGKKRMSLAPKIVLHDDIRRFAARVLGDLSYADVAQELAIALDDKDVELRLTAADSLARIGTRLRPFPDDVTDALMVAANAPDRELKLLVVRALASAEGDKAIGLLTRKLGQEDSFVRWEAVRALASLGHVGAEIEALLGDRDPAVRLSAANAVAGAAQDNAVDLLVDFASSFEGYNSREAARLLRDLDAARASDLFVDVLRDPERKRIWSVAIEALEELNGSQPIQTAEAAGRAVDG